MKTVVITGASRGIGLATARKFLDEGWRVIGTYLNTKFPVEHPNLAAVHLDQGDSASVAEACERIREITSDIDALVNNAGVILDNKDTVASAQKVRSTYEVDVVGLVDLTERLLPCLSEGGHIVNVDSIYGSFSVEIDDATSTAYRMAKAALNMYTRTLAFRLQDKGILVSSLDPGWVKTDMGMSVATETDKPDREPEQAASEIFKLVTLVSESGLFWRFGKRREW